MNAPNPDLDFLIDENNFLHKLLLTALQASKLPKAFANGSSANVKL